MSEEIQSSETDNVPVRVEEEESAYGPVRVISPEGEWVPEVDLRPAAQVDERTRVILGVLEGNAKSVVKAIRQAESTEILELTFELETANKKRKTVLDVIRKRLAELAEAAKPKEPEIFVHGNIKEVRGSLWEDDAGNLYVLAGKVGEPSGVFSLRPTRRTSRRSGTSGS